MRVIRERGVAGASATIDLNVPDIGSSRRRGQTWIAEFTYVWAPYGWLSVAAVGDLFSRRVVGRLIKADRNVPLFAYAFITAIRSVATPTDFSIAPIRKSIHQSAIPDSA